MAYLQTFLKNEQLTPLRAFMLEAREKGLAEAYSPQDLVLDLVYTALFSKELAANIDEGERMQVETDQQRGEGD